MADDEFNLEDVFGPMANRPDTPDFWHISQIMLRQNGAIDDAKTADAKEAVWQAEVRKRVSDPQVLAYMGLQRMLRALGITTRSEVAANASVAPKMITLWMEGFLVGAEFADGNREELKLRLMEMLDGYDALVEDDKFDPLEAAAKAAKRVIDQ